MPGNPSIGAEFPQGRHPSEPAAADPSPDLTHIYAEQRGHADGSAPDRPTSPSLSDEASTELRPVEPAGGLGRLHAPSQYLRPSHARHPSPTPDAETWRDYPLAEIEGPIAELKGKVARFALFRSIQFADETSGPGNEAAFESMNDALEDISAAALGIELASHQEFLRIRSVTRPDRVDPGTNNSQELQDD